MAYEDYGGYGYSNENSYVDPNGGGGGADPAQAAAPAVKTPGSQIAAWYKQYLGRDPENQGVVDAWSGQDAQTAQLGIENSAEAQAYRNRPAAAAPAAAAKPTLQQPNFGNNSQAPIASAQGTNPALLELRNLLMSKASQPVYVDPNDPTIKANADAYTADMTRAGNSFLSRQAEKGGPYGDMGAAYRSVGEKVGQASADYRGKLINDMASGRRQEIAGALAGLGGNVSTDEATRLRQEDQALARSQFGAGTAQQAFQDQYQTIFG